LTRSSHAPILSRNGVSGNPGAVQTGTTTFATIYADGALTTPLANPLEADASGTFVAVYLNPATIYRVQIKTAAGVLISDTDPYVPQPVPPVFARTSAETAAGVTPTSFAFEPGDVRRYGGDPTGATASDTAWANNILQASQNGGAEMTGPGTYLLLTGIVFATNGLRLRTSGMGLTTFKAGANSIILVKVAASYCHLDDFNVDANGFTGVDGLALAPVNESLTSATSQINFNVFGAIQPLNGINNGIRLRAGPSVAGADSGLFYNNFQAIYPRDCVRAIWLQDAVNAGRGGPNRNTFVGVRSGSSGTVINTGVQIDCGSGNHFFGCDFEGINNGTTPNSIPTAIQIKNLNAVGGNNSDNKFYDTVCEANTRDVDNGSSSTCFFGGFITASLMQSSTVISSITSSGTTATVTTATNHGLQNGQRLRFMGQTPAAYSVLAPITVTGATTFTYSTATTPGGNATVVGAFDVVPRVMLGMDPSIAPTVFPGMTYGEGVPGYPSAYWGMYKEIADQNLNWQAYTLSTANVTNAVSVANPTSNFRQLSNMVEWVGIFQFDASVAGTQITITPPVGPNAAQYTALVANAPFYTFSVNNGSSIVQVVAGWTSSGKLYITAPTGNWNTSGNNNLIAFQVSYHI
jgi:hypothetical protein